MNQVYMRECRSLKAHGNRLGRNGMSQRIEQLVLEFISSGDGYKSAMILAGRMKAVAQAAKCDDYWTEQVNKGWQRELNEISDCHAVNPSDDVWFDMIKHTDLPDEDDPDIRDRRTA